MKFWFFFLITSVVHASPVETLPCAKDIQSLATEWKATNEWSKQLQGGLENHFFQSPTGIVGEWVVAKKIPQGAVISKIGQGGRIEVSFEGGNCKKVVKSYPHSAPASGHKVDKDINEFVTKNKEGAIYVWSPRMGLSQNGITEIKKASKNLKLPLLVLLDKDVSEAEHKKLKKALGNVVTERVDSLDFRMRNVGQHFPAIMVFKDSKILPEVKYGFEKSDGYKSDLVRMLGRSE